MIAGTLPGGQTPPHDPLVCGLGADLCAGCRAAPTPASPGNAYDKARERWEALQRDHHRLLRRDGARPWEMSSPLEGEGLCRLVATALSPKHQPLFRALLLDLLGDVISDIALAVAQEVNRGQ